MKGLYTILLLIVSNVFMTFAWYGHLKLQDMKVITNWPLYAIILFSWSIALAEYFCLVPANRIGFIGNGGPFSLIQLNTHHFHSIYYGSFQGRKFALESFCGIHLSGTCGVFCIL